GAALSRAGPTRRGSRLLGYGPETDFRSHHFVGRPRAPRHPTSLHRARAPAPQPLGLPPHQEPVGAGTRARYGAPVAAAQRRGVAGAASPAVFPASGARRPARP